MITAFPARVDAAANFVHRCAPEFTTPDDKRFIQQSALVEVLDEGRNTLLGPLAVVF